MPLRRYFLFIGGVLLALLFLIDWYLPQAALEAAQADVDRTTIRIHSAHKWPSAVVFDTTQPAIAASPEPMRAQATVDKPPVREKSPRDALALASESEVPAVAAATPPTRPKHAKPRVRAARAQAARVATYEPFGFRPFFQPGW
jgi:hypothetical protein